jgi:hypothetical protein
MACLAGPMRGLALAVLGAVLWTGYLPLTASWWSILLLWLPATALTIFAGSALCRGHMTIKEAYCFEISTMAIHLRALRCIVWPGKTSFRVTPKEGTDSGGWIVLRQLVLATLLVAVLVGGIGARIVGAIGWGHLPPLPSLAAWMVPLIAAVEAARMIRTLAHLTRHRQHRHDYRFQCRAPAVAGGQRGHVTDLSRHGASIELDTELPVGAVVGLKLLLDDATGLQHEVDTRAEVRVVRSADAGHRIGVRFVDLAPLSDHAITEYCFVVCVTERLRGLAPHLLPDATDDRIESAQGNAASMHAA